MDDFHQRLYEEAVRLGATVGIEESMPRLAGRQQHRQNIPATSNTDYYRLNITIPLLDHMISELDDHFDADSSAIVVEFIQLLPAGLYNKSSSERLTACTFPQVLELYQDDLPSSRSLDVELELWQAKWEDYLAEDINTPVKALPHADQDYFTNIRTFMLIMITLPITSCECERSISLLRLVKSTLHTTMTEERLNGLALMQYHHDIRLEIVAEFARRNQRRMELQGQLY